MEKVWTNIKVSEEYTTLANIKNKVNLRGHPDVQNRKKYEDEIIK